MSVGTVVDVPRNTESLCNFVRSTPRVVVFSGIFTLEPLDEVSVTVFISTTKERRLVFGGGVSGFAIIVRLSVAVPPPPPPGVFFWPLHEARATVNTNSSAAEIFRTFMQPPG